MGSGFAKKKKQAQMLEKQFEQMREQLKNQEVTGSSGNGLVTVKIDGEKELKEIKIKPDCVDRDDIEGLEDLIKAALEDAYAKLEDNSSDNLFSGNFPFPIG